MHFTVQLLWFMRMLSVISQPHRLYHTAVAQRKVHPAAISIKWVIKGSDIYFVSPHLLLSTSHDVKTIWLLPNYWGLFFFPTHWCCEEISPDKVQNLKLTGATSVWVREYFLQSISYTNWAGGSQCSTHPPESTGETTRTKGGSKGKLSCQMKKKRKKAWVVRNLSPPTPQRTWSQDLLYKRNWAECSPLLPFLLRPASHYVMDYLGLPCNKQQQQLKSHGKHKEVTTKPNNWEWELTSLIWRATHKGCHWLVRLNKYLRNVKETEFYIDLLVGR